MEISHVQAGALPELYLAKYAEMQRRARTHKIELLRHELLSSYERTQFARTRTRHARTWLNSFSRPSIESTTGGPLRAAVGNAPPPCQRRDAVRDAPPQRVLQDGGGCHMASVVHGVAVLSWQRRKARTASSMLGCGLRFVMPESLLMLASGKRLLLPLLEKAFPPLEKAFERWRSLRFISSHTLSSQTWGSGMVNDASGDGTRNAFVCAVGEATCITLLCALSDESICDCTVHWSSRFKALKTALRSHSGDRLISRASIITSSSVPGQGVGER